MASAPDSSRLNERFANWTDDDWSWLRSRFRILSSGCWAWLGPTFASGYGICCRYGVRQRSHHASWYMERGPLPADGSEPDHECRNRWCGNPDHIRWTTRKEQIRRSWPALKTRCVHGHDFTPENTKVDSNGWRACKTCIRINQRKRYRERTAA